MQLGRKILRALAAGKPKLLVQQGKSLVQQETHTAARSVPRVAEESAIYPTTNMHAAARNSPRVTTSLFSPETK